MRQLTIRGFDDELERRLRRLAREAGISLNQAALRLLRRGAGLDDVRPAPDVVGNSLDGLIGCWSERDAQSFQAAIADFERIEPEFWQ